MKQTNLLDKIKQRKKKQPPTLKAEPLRSPLETMEITGNTERDDATEVSLIKKQLMGGKQFMGDAYDMAFYMPIVFFSRAQCDAFLKKMEWDALVDVGGGYLDGIALAKKMGVPLPDVKLPFTKRGEDATLVKAVGCNE